MTLPRGPQLWVSLLVFGGTAAAALLQRWSLPEFCWSTWIAGLAYAWAGVFSGAAGVLWELRRDRAEYDALHPAVERLSGPALFVLVGGLLTVACAVALYVYSYLYGFYGLFLSVFAEMKENPLFVRDGFINSDFWTPVTFLLERFWPMVLGTLAVNVRDLVTGPPWRRLLLPVFSRDILRQHLFIFLLPILTMAAWAVFERDYQPVTVVLLLGVLFLVPKGVPGRRVEGACPRKETEP